MFLDRNLYDTVQYAAAEADISALDVILKRHPKALTSAQVLEALSHIPTFVKAQLYAGLLPSNGQDRQRQLLSGWRAEIDWAERLNVHVANSSIDGNAEDSTQAASKWVLDRVEAIDSQDGDIENALHLIQLAAGRDIPGLDAIGEELSLLYKMVYDRTMQASESTYSTTAWSLSRWRSSTAEDIFAGFLSGSTASTIVDDLKRLALPYLAVLESRAERAGEEGSVAINEILFQWMLAKAGSAATYVLLPPIFAASKATLPKSSRMIKRDEDVVRLALACIYANPDTSSWTHANAIFETLPASNAAETTRTPSWPLDGRGADAHVQASEAYAALLPVPSVDLAHLVDCTDLHLEAAEIFAKWNCSMPLPFFARLSSSAPLQRQWAERLAKTSASAVSTSANGRTSRLGGDFEHEDEWITLLDDLCRLAGSPDGYGDHQPRPAFGLLSKADVAGIFYSGLLSSASESCKKQFIC